MYSKIYLDDIAKDLIKNEPLFDKEDIFIKEWLDEKNVKLYLLYDKDIIVSFSLISKMGKDPLKIHKNPYYINYIYTFEEYRRKGYAYYLVCEIKKNDNVTVFCTDNISKNLFKKAQYIFNDYDKLYNAISIYRYP